MGSLLGNEPTPQKQKTAALTPPPPPIAPPAPTSQTQQAPVAITPVVDGKSILLHLNISPRGGTATIKINGNPVDSNNPASQVPLDAPLEIVVEREGYNSFTRETVIDSKQTNGLKETTIDIALEPSHYGFLTIHTIPSADAIISISGSVWQKKTPIENEKLPAGSYSLRLVNDVLGMEKTVPVTIQEGKAVSIDERLEIKN